MAPAADEHGEAVPSRVATSRVGPPPSEPGPDSRGAHTGVSGREASCSCGWRAGALSTNRVHGASRRRAAKMGTTLGSASAQDTARPAGRGPRQHACAAPAAARADLVPTARAIAVRTGIAPRRPRPTISARATETSPPPAPTSTQRRAGAPRPRRERAVARRAAGETSMAQPLQLTHAAAPAADRLGHAVALYGSRCTTVREGRRPAARLAPARRVGSATSATRRVRRMRRGQPSEAMVTSGWHRPSMVDQAAASAASRCGVQSRAEQAPMSPTLPSSATASASGQPAATLAISPSTFSAVGR